MNAWDDPIHGEVHALAAVRAESVPPRPRLVLRIGIETAPLNPHCEDSKSTFYIKVEMTVAYTVVRNKT